MSPCSSFLRDLESSSSKTCQSFERDEVESRAALNHAFGHLAWALTAAPIPKQRRYLAAAALAGRVMQHAFGAYSLIRAGNTASADVVLRSALEASFAVGGLSNDDNFNDSDDFYLRLLFKSTLGKAKPIEDFLRAASTLRPDMRLKLEQRLSDLKGELDKLKPHQMSKTVAVAKAAGMEDFYQREYASLAQVSHSDIETVVKAHVFMKDDEVRVRGVVFALTDACVHIAHLAAVLMETATAIIRLLRLEIPGDERLRIEQVRKFYGETLQRASSVE